ncbi:hypothetical protein R6Q59_004301 [Mikania micrantha]
MSEENPETNVTATAPRRPRSIEDDESGHSVDVKAMKDDESFEHSMDIKAIGALEVKSETESEDYEEYEDKPTKGEVMGWCFYELCSYFTHTVLLTIVFPLIISQTFSNEPPEPARGWYKNGKGLYCTKKETVLFEALTYARIKVGTMKFSPLEWTSISWFSGLLVAAPLLASVSIHLDHRPNSQLITAIATAIGAIFCLPAGAIKTVWIMPPYVAAIVASNAVGSAFHNRHLGLMVRGFVGATIRKLQFPNRQAVSSQLSLYATAGGCLGSAAIASFTYYMLRNSEGFISLWVVSIFSGILWFAGIAHILTAVRSNGNESSINTNTRVSTRYFISIFNYPHAAGSLVGVFLSSFSTMSIFAGGVLYIVGQLCVPPRDLLFVWLTYFFFSALFLPLLHPIQKLIQSDAVKMQIFGFLLSTLTSGMGYYYRNANWHHNHVLFLAAVQSIASGVLHAHSRILLMDCAPSGKEGVFAAWFSWIRMLGAFVGFAIGSSGVGNMNRSFGAAFMAAVVGIVALIFSNVSSYGGAVAAGHVRKRRETDSPVLGWDEVVKVEEKGGLDGTKDRSIEA